MDRTNNASLCLDFHLPTASSQLALWRLSPAIIKSPPFTSFPPYLCLLCTSGYCCCLVTLYITSLTPSPHPELSLKIYFVFFHYVHLCLSWLGTYVHKCMYPERPWRRHQILPWWSCRHLLNAKDRFRVLDPGSVPQERYVPVAHLSSCSAVSWLFSHTHSRWLSPLVSFSLSL